MRTMRHNGYLPLGCSQTQIDRQLEDNGTIPYSKQELENMMKRWGESESKYLAKSDLEVSKGNYRTFNVTISALALEAVGEDKEEKFVLYFSGAQKGMVLNATNQNLLSDLFGVPDDPSSAESVSAHFKGRRVQIYFEPSVTFAGKRVGGLRLREVQGNSRQAPPPPPPPPAEDAWQDDDSSIPF